MREREPDFRLERLGGGAAADPWVVPSEVYYCLQGQGVMVMETPEGEWAVEELRPGRVLYVPPRWAHRSVNTSSEQDLVTFFIYPGHAGHDYGTIESRGFRKLVLERDGEPRVVDNPRWRAEER